MMEIPVFEYIIINISNLYHNKMGRSLQILQERFVHGGLLSPSPGMMVCKFLRSPSALPLLSFPPSACQQSEPSFSPQTRFSRVNKLNQTEQTQKENSLFFAREGKHTQTL